MGQVANFNRTGRKYGGYLSRQRLFGFYSHFEQLNMRRGEGGDNLADMILF